MTTLNYMKKLINLAKEVGIFYDYYPLYDSGCIIGHGLVLGNNKLYTYEIDENDEKYNKIKKEKE